MKMTISEINQIIKVANLEEIQKSLNHNLSELNTFPYLGNALFYNNNPEVFNYIYNQMNTFENFKNDLFNFLFFSKDSFVNSIIVDNKKTKINQSFLTIDKFPFALKLDKESINTIQKNLFHNANINLFKEPITNYQDNMRDLLTKFILYSPDEVHNTVIPFIHKYEHHKIHFTSSLFNELTNKKLNSHILTGIQPKLSLAIINNDTHISSFSDLQELITLSIDKNSSVIFNMLLNSQLNFYDRNDSFGLLYFNLLINEVFLEMKIVYEESDFNLYKKAIDSAFYDHAISTIMNLFDLHKNSFIFDDEEIEQFNGFCYYAEYFNLQKTLVLFEKTKLNNRILNNTYENEMPVKNKKRL